MTETDRSESDSILIAQTLQGDRESFGVLMQRHQQPLYRLLRGIVRNHGDADDLTQEAFYRALRYLDRFDQARPFRPWLLKIGTNLAFQHLRKARHGRWVSLDEEDPESGRTPMDRVESPGAEEAVRRPLETRRLEEAMETLPPLHRSILTLRAVHEMHYEEIASVLGIPVGTVMSRLSRARLALRRILSAPAATGDKIETGRRP